MLYMLSFHEGKVKFFEGQIDRISRLGPSAPRPLAAGREARTHTLRARPHLKTGELAAKKVTSVLSREQSVSDAGDATEEILDWLVEYRLKYRSVL